MVLSGQQPAQKNNTLTNNEKQNNTGYSLKYIHVLLNFLSL